MRWDISIVTMYIRISVDNYVTGLWAWMTYSKAVAADDMCSNGLHCVLIKRYIVVHSILYHTFRHKTKYIYIYIHVYTYIHIYIYMHTYIHTDVYMYVSIYIRVCMSVYVYVCVYVYICIYYVCVYVCVWNIYIYVCVCARVPCQHLVARLLF